MTDWGKIRIEYITGSLDLRELAEKYGVKYSTIRKYSSAEHWAAQKREHKNKISILTEQKAAEKIADAEAEIKASKANIRLSIWKELERRMVEDVTGLDGSDLRRLVQNYCDMNDLEPGGDELKDDAKDDLLSESLRKLAEELESD